MSEQTDPRSEIDVRPAGELNRDMDAGVRRQSPLRTTHTYVTLGIPEEAFDYIKGRLLQVDGYQDRIEGNLIDMSGIAVVRGKDE
jgi:hypothetical protein